VPERNNTTLNQKGGRKVRKVLLPIAVLVLALSTFAAANELINGSWE